MAELSDFLGRKTEKTPSIPHEVISDNFSAQDQENVILALFQLMATCDLRYLVGLASTLSACATGEGKLSILPKPSN